MKKVLINFAHPARNRSTMNRALRRAVENLDDVTINDLYENYPDFLIDIKREQSLCEEHDVIVFQHPFYWYSTPSIIKEWLDLVLQYGWAFGSDGAALKGKILLQALTAGGDEDSYQKDGYNEFTIAELTSPLQATARLCGMTWLPPFAILGIHRGLSAEQIASYAEDYRRSIIAFRDETMDTTVASSEKYLNSNLESTIRKP
ncbi:MAG: NAD(P)H-dependent oxidoreductase [Verrucomicrobiota bacterium]